jgi:ribosomal subunit interface protein
MELTTRSVHVKTGKKLANSIEHKFSRLEKLYDRIIYCDVTISKEKNAQQKNCVVEAKLEMPKKVLFAKERAENFEMAIDSVVGALESQVTSYKEQLQDVRKIKEQF